MPKMKTNKSAAKRFRVTARGKVRHARAFRRHCLGHKSQDRKRRLRANGDITGQDAHRIGRMLGGIAVRRSTADRAPASAQAAAADSGPAPAAEAATSA